MRKPKKEIQLTSYDELLGINEAEQNNLNQVLSGKLNDAPFGRLFRADLEFLQRCPPL